MYLFPKDPKFRTIWVRNLRRDGFAVTDYSKLCAKHITPDQFKIHPAEWCGYKKLDLRPDAIPILFDIHVRCRLPVKSKKNPRTWTAYSTYFKRRTIEVRTLSIKHQNTDFISQNIIICVVGRIFVNVILKYEFIENLAYT